VTSHLFSQATPHLIDTKDVITSKLKIIQEAKEVEMTLLVGNAG
jgi:hypothetical protein